MALEGKAQRVGELTAVERSRMFELMDAHFEGMDRERFDADLGEKEWVLLLREPGTALVQGFSTAMFIDTDVDGAPVRAVFSGDTIINRAFWGEKTLGVIWLRFVLQVQRETPDRRVVWFLISMGYKTYRLLRLFFRDYWPRRDAPTPPSEQALIDHLGRLKFGDRFDAARGVVTFDGDRERLRPGVADVDEAKGKDPDVAFFVERNPGWTRGDELACVAEISPENLRPRLWRTFGL